MDLCFDGVYRMILLGEIQLPEGIATWGTLTRCFQVLSTIKVSKQISHEVITIILIILMFYLFIIHFSEHC